VIMERWTFGRKIKKEEKPDTAFTKAQRDWIIERDEGTSQMRHYSEEKGFYNHKACPHDGEPCGHLEIHHILPRRVGGGASADNLLTVFKCEHTGVCPSKRIG